MSSTPIGCLARLLFGILALFGIVFLLMIAMGAYLLNSPYEFDEELSIHLPDSLGSGRLPGNISGVVEVDLDFGESLYTSADLLLATNQDNLNQALPEREFSLLVDNTDYPPVSSMLGRLQFVPDSLTLGEIEKEIFVAMRLEGEFYVRPRREYARDEEQPGSNDPLPLGVDLIVSAKDLALTPQWNLSGTTNVTVALDNETRAKLDGKFGQGQDFANYVESVLNDRAKTHAARLDISGVNLRKSINRRFEKVMTSNREEHEDLALLGSSFRVDKVEADACTGVDDKGNISFSIFIEGHIDFEATTLSEIPDLTLRQENC